ncbi:MAG: hypothetical protein RLZZ347_680 [Candidatus Parcubacteria bacterium]|jgi:putative Holliday junction resolvase
MRYLGIDFGTKRIGVALSDAHGSIAFPYSVVANTKTALTEIATIAKKEGVGLIVVGESKDFAGKQNVVMEKITPFAQELEKQSGLPVIFEPEFMSSQQASTFQGTHDKLDASAAAIILQAYLERIKHR